MKGKIIYIMISIIMVILSITILKFVVNDLKYESDNNNLEYIKTENKINNNIEIKQEEITKDLKIGTLSIPKIGLYDIEVCESVELETLSHAIGHFENTNLYEGNVGLASHNAGTNANYFADINKLEKGDEIYYKTNYGTRQYIVDSITEIDSYDWSKLESTDYNMITLITCISGKQNYRLCVQGIEKY